MCSDLHVWTLIVVFHCTWSHHLQFVDHDFAGLSGVRVVRIATHPDFQGMGYGSRALQLLLDYFEGRLPSLGEGAGDTLEPLPTVKVWMSWLLSWLHKQRVLVYFHPEDD